MRIIFFLFFFIYPGTLFANVTLEIEKKLKSINTVIFDFVQKTSGIQEKGKCYLSFPGQLRCIYESDEGKAKEKFEDMCKKLLANLVIENYKIL